MFRANGFGPASGCQEGCGLRQPNLAERQEAAAAAKKELLERHREKMNDPGFAERKAAREAVVAAREIRVAERRAAEEARMAREAAEKASQEAAERAAQEAALDLARRLERL